MEQEADDVEHDEKIRAAMIGFPEDAMLTKSARLRSMHQMEVGFDTLCSHHVFGEQRLISNIKSCDPVTYKGIWGTIVTDQVGEHSIFGRADYCPGIPNLLSVGQLTSESSRANGIEVRISDGAFKVSKGNVSYLFVNDSRNQFVTDLSYDVNGEDCYMIETINQNERLFTKGQVEAARRVRIFASAMRAMAMVDIIGQVRSRRVDVIDFTVEDVARSYEIYGRDLQAVRGKTVEKKLTQALAKEKIVNSRVTLHIDLMFLSGVSFLVGNARPICMLMCNWIKGKGVLAVKKALDRQKASLTSEGFEVVEISSDSEGAIVALEARVSIHDPNTGSAHVDVKIKQLKNVTHSSDYRPPIPTATPAYYVRTVLCMRQDQQET
jgi:hypothetical protein